MITTAKASILSILNSGKIFTGCLCLFASCFAFVESPKAASSDWQDLGGGQARLLAQMDPATKDISGVVEVRLDPEWSTYWRYPGSSGIPPKFDFSQSLNIKIDAIEFPAPKLIAYQNGSYAGYKNHVSFPFNGKIEHTSKAVIDLQLLIGVCSTICIPAQAQMSIELSQLLQSDPIAKRTIAFASQLVPKQKPAKDVILSVEQQAHDFLSIEVSHQAAFGKPSLFVEGPDNWYLQPAKLIEQEETSAKFRLDVSQIPQGVDPQSAKLTYTLVSGNQGIETTR